MIHKILNLFKFRRCAKIIKRVDIFGTEYRDVKGRYHNPHGPAFVGDFSTNYFLHGKQHNIVGPYLSSQLHKTYKINNHSIQDT